MNKETAHQLSATRNELELTRTELAANRTAQEEQVRLTFVAAQLDSLNMKLSRKLADLNHTRGVMAEMRHTIHTKGRYSERITPDGARYDLFDIIETQRVVRDQIAKDMDDLHEQIDKLIQSCLKPTPGITDTSAVEPPASS